MKFIKRIKFNSPVVLTFVFICLVALILSYITNGYSNLLLFSVYRTRLGFSIFSIFRMIGHIFGHVDISHFISNMMIILLVGPMLEEKYKSNNMILLILVTAVVTAIVHVTFSKSILLGASGIVYAFIVLSSFTYVSKDEIPLTFILIVILYFGGQIIDGLFVQDNISQLSHIIGGIVGACFGFYLNKSNN